MKGGSFKNLQTKKSLRHVWKWQISTACMKIATSTERFRDHNIRRHNVNRRKRIRNSWRPNQHHHSVSTEKGQANQATPTISSVDDSLSRSKHAYLETTIEKQPKTEEIIPSNRLDASLPIEYSSQKNA